ncbi:MAG: hypothetical protein ACODTU_03185 [Pigmentiphaga sp.]|uniref:hypothetical protein n=1 Tax=Pigmentiphaga sp. TaxID=1977564 RepID=UPI003B57E25D
MGIDEAGHDDHPARVDDLRAGRGQLAAHRDDGAVAYVDVAFGQVAHVPVHRQHMAAGNQELPARRPRAFRLGLGPCVARQGGTGPGHRRRHRTAQEIPPVQAAACGVRRRALFVRHAIPLFLL